MADRDLPDLSRFLVEYLDDARENFLAANRALLTLEKDPGQTDCLKEIFRALHTLKSSSAMLKFNSIAQLAHFSEDVLDRIRSQELPLNQYAINVLLEAIDSLEAMVRRRADGESEEAQIPVATSQIEAMKARISALESQESLSRHAMAVIDASGQVVSFNAAAERLFGYTAREIIGQNVRVLMPEPYRSEHDAYIASYLGSGKPKIIGIDRELAGVRRDGSQFPLELAVDELMLGEQRLFIGLMREVTRFEQRVRTSASVATIPNIRVHVGLLDSLFNLVGELIITRNRIDTLVPRGAQKELKSALATMDRLINELQEDVTAARLVPVDEIVQKFPRLVRDLALEHGKEIDLLLEGRNIELDKGVLDAIGEPLVHLLRNAVDHGIELPEVRQAHHKPRRGTVRISAQRAENRIIIQVADDGAGIDLSDVRRIAADRSIVTTEVASALADKAVLELIFAPGFTTTREPTGLSGRGVGLDVVKTSAERLGGAVTVTTQPEHGTCFSMHLPLATAIIQTLMVSAGDHVFAIPSDIVLETVELRPGDVRAVGNENVLVLRGDIVSYVKLAQILAIPLPGNQREQNAVIVHRGDELVGLGVEMVLDQVENIIKPFDPVAQKLRGFSGGTILGDGRVALLLDIPALL